MTSNLSFHHTNIQPYSCFLSSKEMFALIKEALYKAPISIWYKTHSFTRIITKKEKLFQHFNLFLLKKKSLCSQHQRHSKHNKIFKDPLKESLLCMTAIGVSLGNFPPQELHIMYTTRNEICANDKVNVDYVLIYSQIHI